MIANHRLDLLATVVVLHYGLEHWNRRLTYYDIFDYVCEYILGYFVCIYYKTSCTVRSNSITKIIAKSTKKKKIRVENNVFNVFKRSNHWNWLNWLQSSLTLLITLHACIIVYVKCWQWWEWCIRCIRPHITHIAHIRLLHNQKWLFSIRLKRVFSFLTFSGFGTASKISFYHFYISLFGIEAIFTICCKMLYILCCAEIRKIKMPGK